jgi:hypothetical protein
LFNLLISGSEWAKSRDTMPIGRVFEYTDQELIANFRAADGTINLSALSSLPCLFMQETFGDRSREVRVGTIIHAAISGKDVLLEYVLDPRIPHFTNSVIEDLAQEFGISNTFEFSRTHWAIKDINLFQVLLLNLPPRRQQPKVFTISDPERIEHTLVSAMMPFHPDFDNVYGKIKILSESVGLHCRRADDIWENPAVIQDVVSLIDRSKLVICDCSGRNPNVFYEIGIAHTLGRETILITQSEYDIPFDLRHLRYVQYLNNGEGISALCAKLLPRLQNLI